ncbi:MAG: dihydroneopterin aldolase [bacterium]|nr:dihydroneopterin aldolase [bacterium]
MHYSIGIADYELVLRIGCHPGERLHKQPVYYSVELSVLGNAHDTDDINDAPNYYSLSEAVKSQCESKEYALLERLCYDIGQLYLSDERVIEVVVTVHKPEALPNAQSASVTMSFLRD